MFGNVVLESKSTISTRYRRAQEKTGAKFDTDLTAEDLIASSWIIEAGREKKTAETVPHEARQQLAMARTPSSALEWKAPIHIAE